MNSTWKKAAALAAMAAMTLTFAGCGGDKKEGEKKSAGRQCQGTDHVYGRGRAGSQSSGVRV